MSQSSVSKAYLIVSFKEREKDYANHIANAIAFGKWRSHIALDPSEEWIFIVDRLNTHQSEGFPENKILIIKVRT